MWVYLTSYHIYNSNDPLNIAGDILLKIAVQLAILWVYLISLYINCGKGKVGKCRMGRDTPGKYSSYKFLTAMKVSALKVLSARHGPRQFLKLARLTGTKYTHTELGLNNN